MAAVQQAMQQYGQDEDDENPQGARQLEQMMNAMIEQAYDEDMEVQVFQESAQLPSPTDMLVACPAQVSEQAVMLWSFIIHVLMPRCSKHC